MSTTTKKPTIKKDPRYNSYGDPISPYDLNSIAIERRRTGHPLTPPDKSGYEPRALWWKK